MSVAFITRAPTTEEVELLRLAFSTFCDGSGMVMLKDGNTVPGWRDLERAFAEAFQGTAPEGKQIFDVFVPSTKSSTLVYGMSVKSKQRSRKEFDAFQDGSGRVYMELSNSPAKFWAPLHGKGITEADFRKRKHAEVIGPSVLEVIEGWHREDAAKFAEENEGKTLSLTHSAYVTVSNCQATKRLPRQYQIHSFDLPFPRDIHWYYASEKCLRGADPKWPNETLFDWYGLSGGQLKYYPRTSAARHSSPVFTLAVPRARTLHEKSARYWPVEFRKAGGSFQLSAVQYAAEMDKLLLLQETKEAAAIIKEATAKLRNLGPKK